MQDQIEESILFHNSINEYKYKQNLLLYLWLMVKNRNMEPFEYFKTIPYELIREISEFLLLGDKPKYYKIIDNTVFYNNQVSLNKANRYLTKWWEKRLRTKFIGKCIKKRSTCYNLPNNVIYTLLSYLNNKQNKKNFLLTLSKFRIKSYNVKYVGWAEDFNERVSIKQLSLINTFNNRYTDLKIGCFIDCKHPINNKYYRGMVVNIHYNGNIIVGVDVILESGRKGSYIWMPYVPLYSDIVTGKNMHNL